MADDEDEQPNYVIGFFLTLVAGLATVVGVAFIPLLKYGAGQTVTSAALGFAAGVMLYVSFVDVLGDEAKELFEGHFEEANPEGKEGDHDIQIRIQVALFFFIGLAIAMGLEKGMDALGLGENHDDHGSSQNARNVELTANSSHSGQDPEAPGSGTTQNLADKHGHNHSLERVSMIAFVALTMHNFPEGLATFFGGGTGSFTVPFAIAMHNIPEGAAIAIPIYQSKGDFMMAVRNTCIAGLAQPAGALVGWLLILALGLKDLSKYVYGALYASTAGIMVCVSLMELLPSALQGASPFFVGCFTFAGFAVMEVSIILLGLAGV